MPQFDYEYRLYPVDVDTDDEPDYGYDIYSVSDAELNRTRQALQGKVFTFRCYPYQVPVRLRQRAEPILAAVDPPLSFGEILVNDSLPIANGTSWDPVAVSSTYVLHPSEDRTQNVCLSVQGTSGSWIWRQLAFEARLVRAIPVP